VGIYVHSSLRTDQWCVRSYPGNNRDIFAALKLKAPSEPFYHSRRLQP
jgi:hypothetical protein